MKMIVERILPFSIDRVYASFIDPEVQKLWIPPDGYTCTALETDAQVGGAAKGTFRDAEGNESSWEGTFTVVEARQCLEYDFSLSAMGQTLEGLTNRIEFESVESGTRLRIFLKTEIAELRDGASIGWGQSLDKLNALLGDTTGR